MSTHNEDQRRRSDQLNLASDQESYLSAACACAWHSMAGWIIPLAILLLICSKLWTADRPSGIVDDAIDGPTRITLAQSASRSSAVGPFDLSDATIPRDEIMPGGPPKDGIPALSAPQLIAAAKATYLRPHDRVIGYARGHEARAYPLKILNYHEIVNDRVGETPVAVTYCPLCDSAAIFDRRTPLGEREFGVSGLLYNSNVLMYDRSGQRDSLWSQVKAEGVSGPGSKSKLQTLPLELTTWGDWVTRHPETLVLSPQTGHTHDYDRDPYTGYFQRPELMFPARPTSNRLPKKVRVLGVWTDEAARAYPVTAFGQQRKQLVERVGGKRVVVEFDPAVQSLRVVDAEDGVQWMYSLWFAWHAFRPHTEVFQ